MGKLKELLKPAYYWLLDSDLAVPCWYLWDAYLVARFSLYGKPKIDEQDRENVRKNLTFIYKSFNRQKFATRLYRKLCEYYPGANIIIADDSEVPLEIPGAHIIHLPFNSGLSKGLIAALNEVKTEYVMRLDDDFLPTPKSNVHGQLRFLQEHPEVDLAGIQIGMGPKKDAECFRNIKMNKKLIIPAGTIIDGHEVVYKTANCYVARTEKIREVGYDPNIRMIDHHEFFYRAAGKIVSVMDPNAYMVTYQNRFDREYRKFRNDYQGDILYIRQKRALERLKQQEQAARTSDKG